MIDLEPIQDDLNCNLLSRGDKVELIQDLLIDKGYKLLEVSEYMKDFNWDK